MFNGNDIFKPVPQPSNDIQTLKNRVITVRENVLLGARCELFWLQGMFEIVHPAQKMTGVC
jgi:hypothetical protein